MAREHQLELDRQEKVEGETAHDVEPFGRILEYVYEDRVAPAESTVRPPISRPLLGRAFDDRDARHDFSLPSRSDDSEVRGIGAGAIRTGRYSGFWKSKVFLARLLRSFQNPG